MKTKKRLLGILLSLVMVLGRMPGLSMTAFASAPENTDIGIQLGEASIPSTPYAALLNTTTAVKFDSIDWYLIEDDSTALHAGTVTLLSKECVGASQYDSSGSYVEYASSTVKTEVDTWYQNNISANAKTAVNGSKMFLLTKDQAEGIDAGVRKCDKASGVAENVWWLCSQGETSGSVAAVDGDGGAVVDGLPAGTPYGVRPALKLDLSKVAFDDTANTFSLTCTITFEANGGSGSMEDQQVDAGSEYKLPASQFTAPSGKQFSAWDISGQNYKVGDRYTVQHDVTVRAVWTNAATPSIAPGASNSGGTDAITVPVSGDANTVSVSATVRGDTATVQKLTDKQLEKVIGEGVRTGAITIDASGLGTEINKVAIPTNTVKAITEAVNDPENDATGLTAVLTGGSLGFDGPALDAILEQTRGSTVTVCLADVGVAGLNDTQQAAVAELDVRKVLDAKVTSGSSSISDFRGGTATISTGCELNESERPGGVEVYHVADDGEVIRMASIFRDSRVTIAVSHNSNYVIAYDEELAAVCPQDGSCPLSDFSDLDPAAWYHDGIHYALENGMMNGTGNGTFAPEAETSRAMIVTMLWRMEGKPAYSGMPDYTDVEEDSWYTPAVRWASSEGIVNGYDESTFGPEDSVTREQLAAILYRCAQSKGQGFTGAWMFPLDYPDAADISEWADEAMHWMVMQGIIRGTGDGELNPQGKASRAEAATMLMRFAELDAQA